MTTSISAVTVEDLLSNAAWARRLALNLLSDRDTADDLVQETWIAALRARPDASQSLRPWLAQVLRNRAAKHTRDDSRRARRHDRAGDLVGGATGADPETLLGRMQVQRVLAELITGLREPTRQTVLLRYYEGLTSEQIGGIMGVAAGTVRRRLKEAIAELRDELDRRHEGRRDAWLLALLPLDAQLEPGDSGPPPASPRAEPPSHAAAEPPSLAPVGTATVAAPARRTLRRPAAVSLPTLAIGALVVSVVAGGLLLAWLWLVPQPPGGRGAEASGPPGNGRGGGAWLAAALPGTFESCRGALAARRKEVAAAETVYLRRAPRDVLFEEGTANPTARAALLPELERVMRGDAGAGLSFTFECRTWACRLLVLHPEDGPEDAGFSESDIPKHPGLKERLRDWSIPLPEKLTRDPITGASYAEETIYLVLKMPSGARVAGAPPAIDAAPDVRPEPRTLVACERELQAAGERLTYVRRVNDDRMSLIERYRESEYDPVLTLDMKVLLIRALRAGAQNRTPDVFCRGRVCRVSVPAQTSPDDWRQRLVRDPVVSRRISETVVTPEALMLVIHEPGPGRENRSALVLKLGKDILAANLPTCAARFPAAAGELLIALLFPDTRQAPPPGAPPPAITVRLRGPLADTPLARCVEQEVTRAAGAATPFADSPSGSITFRRNFPLDPAEK